MQAPTANKTQKTQRSIPVVRNLSVRTCYKCNESARKLGQLGCKSTVLNAAHAQTPQYSYKNLCVQHNHFDRGVWGGVGTGVQQSGELVGGGGGGRVVEVGGRGEGAGRGNLTLNNEIILHKRIQARGK